MQPELASLLEASNGPNSRSKFALRTAQLQPAAAQTKLRQPLPASRWLLELCTALASRDLVSLVPSACHNRRRRLGSQGEWKARQT